MKLTWFGGTTLRLHIGGSIVVIDPDAALPTIKSAELRSGADVLLCLADPKIPKRDLREWMPRRVERVIDEDSTAPILFWRGDEKSVLVDAVGEPPLFLACDRGFPFGRWERDAVVVLFLGLPDCVHLVGGGLVGDIAPRLVLLAGDDREVEIALSMLRDKLDTSFLSLEPGLALEV